MFQTKEILKDTFWVILEEKPYNKITVQDIVNRCHVNRNTFYYHFQDIPSLMTESIENWFEEIAEQYGAFTSPVDCMTYMAEECMKRKKAFLHLFCSTHKDAFISGLNEMGYKIIHTYVDMLAKRSPMSTEEKEMYVRCYKCVFVGSLLDWLGSGASYDLAEFYKELCTVFSHSIPS